MPARLHLTRSFWLHMRSSNCPCSRFCWKSALRSFVRLESVSGSIPDNELKLTSKMRVLRSESRDEGSLPVKRLCPSIRITTLARLVIVAGRRIPAKLFPLSEQVRKSDIFSKREEGSRPERSLSASLLQRSYCCGRVSKWLEGCDVGEGSCRGQRLLGCFHGCKEKISCRMNE